MDTRISFKGIKESPWMKDYLESKVARLGRYLPQDAMLLISLSDNGTVFTAELRIRTPKHSYTYFSEGFDLFEAFTRVLEESSLRLRNKHARLRERIHRKFTQTEESPL
jgi:ribosome-associated translation inhibitor RaiA